MNKYQHFKLINAHRFLVFKFCFKAGIPIRGLLHDLSKYSKIEFLESAKFFCGDKSPIMNARNKQGYSLAWLSHRAKNKHHPEYWYDQFSPEVPKIPYKYMIEMVCDMLAASIIYNKENFNCSKPYEYWQNKKFNVPMHPASQKMLDDILLQLSQKGIQATINRKNFKSYQKLVNY